MGWKSQQFDGSICHLLLRGKEIEVFLVGGSWVSVGFGCVVGCLLVVFWVLTSKEGVGVSLGVYFGLLCFFFFFSLCSLFLCIPYIYFLCT
jgi:hypothetical protein